MNFSPLAFFINRPRLGSCFISYIFFEICFEFVELFKFEIRPMLWAIAGNQIFFVDTKYLKLGWYRARLLLFIYMHFSASLSYKGYGNLLKTVVYFCALVNSVWVWLHGP
jgi:hypothetical protein